MKLTTVLFHTAKLPHRIQYVCPVCDGDNHDMLPDGLANLSCCKCGTPLDGSEASIEIINQNVTDLPAGSFVAPAPSDPPSPKPE